MPGSIDLKKYLVDTTTFVPEETSEESRNALRKLRKRLENITAGSEGIVRDRELIKILRYKKYDVDRAFRIVAMMCKNEREQNLAHMPYGKGPKDFRFVYDLQSFELLRHRNPKDGSAVAIIRIGEWTVNSGVDYSQVMQSATYIVDHMLDDDEIQKNGTTLILDYRGLQLSWILQFLPPHRIPSVLSNLQEGCPLKIRAIHVVNQPLTYNVAYALASPFISKKNQAKIKLHGSHLEALHEFIEPAILPKDLLGDQEPDFEWFFDSLYKLHDDYASRSELARDKANEAHPRG